MPPKRKGLRLIQREADDIKTQVDLLFKDVPGCGNTQELLLRCRNLRSLAEKTLSALNNLNKSEESAPMVNYEQSKAEEQGRLRGLMERLDRLALQLSPPAPVPHDIRGKEEGDLSVQKGEVLTIIKRSADGWWLAEDRKGNRGMVPRTFLKVGSLWAKYRGSRFILPELSQSQLAFKDIFMEPNTGEVRGRQVKVCVCFSLWACRMIAQPGVGVQVLSNVHTVRATYNPKNPKTWTFSSRVNGDLPTLLDGECFLRCSADSPELGLLLELGVTFTRTSTGETGELSCGWAFLKLKDTTASPQANPSPTQSPSRLSPLLLQSFLSYWTRPTFWTLSKVPGSMRSTL
ncbi:hypothetical protein NHX12_022061 [Muraenolepis orangiensis]|uniref:SH3 domain-containing protein n=1 Tax=Muraenolepis orangiensis TaxID=630683 RepID=A0A9Q0ELR0_9TELE|nr:hypothetical protein NHX12_022061 [Muraenolepis orangiensis]